jgi:hypothetical protein
LTNISGLARVVRPPQGVGEGRRGRQVRRRPEEGQGRIDQLAGLHEPSRLHRVRKGHQQSGLEICSNQILYVQILAIFFVQKFVRIVQVRVFKDCQQSVQEIC